MIKLKNIILEDLSENNLGTIKALQQVRSDLRNYYAVIVRYNEFSRKQYITMEARVNQNRDNLAKDWESTLKEYRKVESDTMSKIHTLLKKESQLLKKL
tara:strand:+ start:440 stop:736 length:297 start_codon:yes stop_codon:yes gene_type:complete